MDAPFFSQTAAGYTIPVGHQVCVSPTVNHRLRDAWVERMEFRPERYLDDNLAAGEKFAYVPFGAGKKNTIKTEYFVFSLISSSKSKEIFYQLPSSSVTRIESA